MITLEQQKKERIERLVWSPTAASLPLLDLASMPHPIPKFSPGRGCCQVPGTAVDFLHVPCQGYDPDAKAAFQPKAKQKGRSSTASLVKRKKVVMDQEHRVRELGARCQHAHLQPRPASASLGQPLLTALCPFPTLFPGQSPAEP